METTSGNAETGETDFQSVKELCMFDGRCKRFNCRYEHVIGEGGKEWCKFDKSCVRMACFYRHTNKDGPRAPLGRTMHGDGDRSRGRVAAAGVEVEARLGMRISELQTQIGVMNATIGEQGVILRALKAEHLYLSRVGADIDDWKDAVLTKSQAARELVNAQFFEEAMDEMGAKLASLVARLDAEAGAEVGEEGVVGARDERAHALGAELRDGQLEARIAAAECGLQQLGTRLSGFEEQHRAAEAKVMEVEKAVGVCGEAHGSALLKAQEHSMRMIAEMGGRVSSVEQALNGHGDTFGDRTVKLQERATQLGEKVGALEEGMMAVEKAVHELGVVHDGALSRMQEHTAMRTAELEARLLVAAQALEKHDETHGRALAKLQGVVTQLDGKVAENDACLRRLHQTVDEAAEQHTELADRVRLLEDASLAAPGGKDLAELKRLADRLESQAGIGSGGYEQLDARLTKMERGYDAVLKELYRKGGLVASHARLREFVERRVKRVEDRATAAMIQIGALDDLVGKIEERAASVAGEAALPGADSSHEAMTPPPPISCSSGSSGRSGSLVDGPHDDGYVA